MIDNGLDLKIIRPRIGVKLKILVVDDHVLFREGLVSMLSNNPDISVVGEASTIKSAIEKSLELHPDIVLLDHSLPDGSGIDAVGEILAAWPDTKIIMLTITESDDLLIRAVSNGAVGYLLKNIPISKLFRVLNGVSNGEAALSRKMTARILKEFSLVSRTRQVKDQNELILTSRETEILRLLGTGVSNQEIADHLVISINTVKVHVHNILEKLNLRNRREAEQLARQHIYSPASANLDTTGQ